MVTCDLCRATMPSVNAALNADWLPSYWDLTPGCERGPACPICAKVFLAECPETGEMVLPALADFA
jgi:hypothetical protein